MSSLDLVSDPVALTAALVDVASVSGAEQELADLVERALREIDALEVVRNGDAVLARTNFGLASRIVLAGHLDTVPINDNLPSRLVGAGDTELLYGCGSADMKAGDAVFLHVAQLLTAHRPTHDLTFVFYDCEEIEAARNGLGRIERTAPDWLDGDLAIVGEPSNASIEAGCQGTLRVQIPVTGARAHTARAWMGSNAIHAAGEVLRRLDDYTPRRPVIDGCRYHEGMQAVAISGGVAGNVVPDSCVVTVNHRFAPDRSEAQALEHVQQVFEGFELHVTDSSPGALPGLNAPAAAALLAAAKTEPVAKLGWTDVARFAALGLPAVNFGPGDPTLAHTQDEHVPATDIRHCAAVLRSLIFGAD